MFAKAFHLFQHRMELEVKGRHPNITEFVKPNSNGLRGADQACAPVRSNMTSRVSIRERGHSFPVNTSNCFFRAQAMQLGMFFLGGGVVPAVVVLAALQLPLVFGAPSVEVYAC